MNGSAPAPSRLPAAILLPGAAALAAFAQLLLLPWDPRSNVPVSPGSDTLTTGYTWWGTALFAVVLAALAWAVGRWYRTGAAVLVVGGVPAVLLLASFLAHEPDPDGFAGLWPTSWLSGAVLMLAGTALVAGWAGVDLPRTAQALLVPLLVAGAAALSGFLWESVASDEGWIARVVSAVLASAAGYGLGRVLRVCGWDARWSVALTTGAVLLIAVVDSASGPLWGWAPPDVTAWLVTVTAYVAGTASAWAWWTRT
ncbi:hypothetical protein EV284_4593 [Streptomyces sp. BK022]|uniref:hypothetical protein n=1 Tax=Streptomyces sp. BK022 TaxID=2512123 RepID=UPI0010E54DF6|nr:hypothetical protein [Streptomyces sp. BK022]RZU34988.1 hypothetical protein EV284_4593 [Streptomyces sp. BK022]